jgi:hypothetical protein
LSVAETFSKAKPITVYRGYQSGATAAEKNLTRIQRPQEFIAKLRGESVPETQLLPFEYYTESKDVAKMYANQDEFLIQKLLRTEEMLGAGEKATRQKAEEAFELVVGRKPTKGYVKEHQIAPKKVLDLSHLGENPEWHEVIDELMRAEGSISTKETGWTANRDRFEQIGMDFVYKKTPVNPEDRSFPVWKLMRNAGPNDLSGAKFAEWLKQHGYDTVKYAEQGTNHYAILKEIQ